MPEMTLDKSSSDKEIATWIASYTRLCMHEGGRSQDQCVAIAYDMARKASGRRVERPGAKGGGGK